MILLVDNKLSVGDIDHLRKAMSELGQPHKVMLSSEMIDLEELARCKGVILSGGPWDLMKPMLFQEMKLNFQVMINATMPVYGICMGHEYMAEGDGAEMSQWPEQYKGMREIELLTQEGLFKGLPPIVEMMEWHTQWVATIPSGFELIATAKELRIEGMHHPSRKFYSTQFHPELSGTHGLQILQNFIDICDADVAKN